MFFLHHHGSGTVRGKAVDPTPKQRSCHEVLAHLLVWILLERNLTTQVRFVHLHSKQRIQHRVCCPLLEDSRVQTWDVRCCSEPSEFSRRRDATQASSQQMLLLTQLFFSFLACLFSFRFKQDLAHLWSSLPQSLACLLTSGIITNFVPKASLFVPFEETPVVLPDGAHDCSRDGRFVVLARLEVRTSVEIDQVTEVAVTRMDICATTPATEDVVVVEIRKSLFAWRHRSWARVVGWTGFVGFFTFHLLRGLRFLLFFSLSLGFRSGI
mmetsp:Transcript_5588/g.12392  ORF Transcript_5588/g.12392 Transcript_5588/m.12392 type:complete len:268 (+) Transcript_5588:110-913(+)